MSDVRHLLAGLYRARQSCCFHAPLPSGDCSANWQTGSRLIACGKRCPDSTNSDSDPPPYANPVQRVIAYLMYFNYKWGTACLFYCWRSRDWLATCSLITGASKLAFLNRTTHSNPRNINFDDSGGRDFDTGIFWTPHDASHIKTIANVLYSECRHGSAET